MANPRAGSEAKARSMAMLVTTPEAGPILRPTLQEAPGGVSSQL